MNADPSDDPPDIAFCRLVQSRPAFLLLGQDWLRLGTGTDAFLAEAIRKYNVSGGAAESYDELLRGADAVTYEATVAWMDALCRRLGPPQWITTVAGVAWNGVYSSAIDSVWARSFRNEWRDIRPLFDEKYRPTDPRNRVQLLCTFLFGGVNRAEEAETPPLTQLAFAKRRQVAVSLLRRLPELITPLGSLAIEAYAFERDWLKQDDLWSIVDELNPGQTHVFSVAEETLRHPFAKHLLSTGKLIPYRYSLATALTRGAEAGVIRLHEVPREEGTGRSLVLGANAVTIPRELWNSTNRAAAILDDTVLAPPPRLSPELRYRDFRRFLANADGRPNWESYAQGYAFERAFQPELQSRIERYLASKELLEEPVLLHGQTGTGKTVALATLAYSVRKRLRYPVLFIERKTQWPSVSDVDRFCKWAEDSSAPACLIVWDGMLEPDEYSDFLRQLTSRGRKAVLVGSTYRLPNSDRGSISVVEAPATLSTDETARFKDFLGSFDPSLAAAVDPRAFAGDDTFLVALYRLLPATRGQIRTGVSREVGFAEQVISRRAAETTEPAAPRTALGLALQRAGLLSATSFAGTEGSPDAASIATLTNLVMVPGRFGLVVPLEVLLRVLGKAAYSGLSLLFRDIDVFHWQEDAGGNIAVGPRNALEARLLVQARLGGPREETSTADRLLMEIRDDDGGGGGEGREIRFAVDLVRAMGAQGHEASYFAPYFDRIAETLRALREGRGVRNPRLMLQEANLSREWAIRRARMGSTDSGVVDALERAEEVLRSALEAADADRRYQPLRSTLAVELGAVLASRTRLLLDTEGRRGEGVELYSVLRDALEDARLEDPSSYYPIDVLAWSTRDLLERGALSRQERAEAISEVLYAFQSTDPTDLRADQVERYHSRRQEFAGLIGAADLEEQSFEELAALGSSAGFYLRALQLAGLLRRTQRNELPERSQLRPALAYLEEHAAQVAQDAKCQSLRFDLWWWINAGARLFDHERTALPFSLAAWRDCLGAVDALLRLGPVHNQAALGFVRAMALFHLGDMTEAFESFREVERESERVRGRRRVVRSYVASTADGKPMKVHGTVSWLADDANKGEVFVEEFRWRVPFIPRDFGRLDLVRGDSLGEFHIAFNFIGPIADPQTYFRP